MANTFQNVLVENISTSTTTFYTVDTALTATIVIGFTISNKDNVNDITASINIVRSGGTPVVSLIRDVSIPPQSTLSPLDGKIVLLPGDYIEGSCSALNSADLHLSIMEMS